MPVFSTRFGQDSTIRNDSDIAIPSIQVCITAWNGIGIVAPNVTQQMGGLEAFAGQFAAALAEVPHWNVRFVCRHTANVAISSDLPFSVAVHVEPLRQVRHRFSQAIGIERTFPWIRWKRWDPHLLFDLPRLLFARFFRKRSPQQELRQFVTDLMATGDQQLWVVLGCSPESAMVVEAAQAAKIPAVLWIRSNAELDSRFLTDDFTNEYGVSSRDVLSCLRAPYILCQTEYQRRTLAECWGQLACVIPNPVEQSRWPRGTFSEGEYVLWIGRYDEMHKRPEICLSAARLLPDIPFHMVINRGDPEVEQRVRRNLPQNVTLIDYVPRAEMPELYRRARLFLSTGSPLHEGFPNVLLEAAASATPIVACADFDNFISNSHAGRVSSAEPDQLAQTCRELWSDPHEWQRHSESGRQYIASHHEFASIVRRFTNFVETAVHWSTPECTKSDQEDTDGHAGGEVT